jgi:hypothetical protein
VEIAVAGALVAMNDEELAVHAVGVNVHAHGTHGLHAVVAAAFHLLGEQPCIFQARS